VGALQGSIRTVTTMEEECILHRVLHCGTRTRFLDREWSLLHRKDGQMNATLKLIHRKPYLQPGVPLCIVLILLTLHPAVSADISTVNYTPQTVAVTDATVAPAPLLLTTTNYGTELQNGSGGVQSIGLGGCIVALVGMGVGAYFGMRYLCKIAGLIPTNAPPPPNPPPAPPATNRPPTWTNNVPITLTSGGSFKMFTLVTESSMMPDTVRDRLLAGTTSQNPLFKTDLPDDAISGVAVFNCMNWNGLYTNTLYLDPQGNPYERCLRTTIQSSSVLASGTTNSWRTLMTMYIWINNQSKCISIYDAQGTLRENIVGPGTAQVVVQSIDYVITHWWNPAGATFYRTWSGIEPTP